ncbi:hypothetical protein PybrP1_010381 [[Pythium] brassicae (nom. inval.)]|nr:hypothetical protein PybrP1_010381 [[Pythium] brassicae (nom. inval.)]
MRYIAAYLLAVLGGNAAPSAADVTKILSSVGVEADLDHLSKLLAELEGKDVNKIIAAGSKKLAKFGGGGAAAAAGAAAGGAAAAAPVEEEKEEEEEADMGGAMDMGVSRLPLRQSLQRALARLRSHVDALDVRVVLLVVHDLRLEHRRLDVQVRLGEHDAGEVGRHLAERRVHLVASLGRHEEALEVVLLRKLLVLGSFHSAQVVQVD